MTEQDKKPSKPDVSKPDISSYDAYVRAVKEEIGVKILTEELAQYLMRMYISKTPVSVVVDNLEKMKEV